MDMYPSNLFTLDPRFMRLILYVESIICMCEYKTNYHTTNGLNWGGGEGGSELGTKVSYLIRYLIGLNRSLVFGPHRVCNAIKKNDIELT